MHTSEAALERTTMRRVYWRLLPFLLLLYIISWLDRVNVSFAKLQMGPDLGIGDAAYGVGAGLAFFLSYALCEVPSNLLLARYGARVWIARIMVTWGIISVGMMFVQGVWSFYVLRFLLGAAEAGFLPGIIYYLSHWFPRSYRAKAVSWFMIGIPLSVVFGAPLSGWIMQSMDEYLGLHGWQWMFVIEGFPAVLLGFVVLGYLTEKPSDARWLSEAQRNWLSQRIASEHEEAHQRQGLPVLAALSHPVAWLLAVIMFCCQTGSYGLTFWVPSIVNSLSGYTELEVGLFSAIPYVAAAIGMVLVSMSSDRTGERFLHVAIPSLVGAAGFIAVGMFASPGLAMAALAVAAVGDYCTRGPFWALPGKFLTGSALAGSIALINAMGAVGGIVGPTAVGWLKQTTGSFVAPMMALSGVLVLGAILTLWLRRSPLLR
jgi:ACS family tartrate transporter-like MFS transporter